jgi:hypothetical protein
MVQLGADDDFDSWTEELEGFLVIFRGDENFVPIAPELVVDETVPVCQKNSTVDSRFNEVVYLESRNNEVPQMKHARDFEPNVMSGCGFVSQQLPQLFYHENFFRRRLLAD